jgi:nicotinamidase-related amidase
MRAPDILEARPTLMVVDMQSQFLTSANAKICDIVAKFVANVSYLIESAVRGGEQIALVQWEGCGPIDTSIWRAASKASKLVKLRKESMDVLNETRDSYRENLAILSPLCGSSAKVRLAGVSATACVAETCKGLSRHGIETVALGHAILDHPDIHHLGSYRQFNEQAEIARAFTDVPANRKFLDVSRLGSQENLVDAQLRIFATRLSGESSRT